jgi:glycosyltransferase involved in cell wall biosynthesis
MRACTFERMAEGEPAVDVILPTRQAGPGVHEAIESVLAQTHRALRLTVVDDASPDGTAEAIFARFGDAGGRLGLLCLGRRVGAAAARNEAVRRTGAPLVAFIDEHSRWRPAKLERQLGRLREGPAVQLVHTDVAHLDAAGREHPGEAEPDAARRRAVAWDRLDRDALVRECFRRTDIRLATVVVRRDVFEAVGGFDARLPGGEVWELWLRLAAAGTRFAHLPEPLVLCRTHPGDASGAALASRREGHFAAIDAVLARHPELAELADPLRTRLLRGEIRAQLRAGCGPEARSALRRLRRLRGGSARLVALWLLSFAGPPLPRLVRALERAEPGAGGHGRR